MGDKLLYWHNHGDWVRNPADDSWVWNQTGYRAGYMEWIAEIELRKNEKREYWELKVKKLKSSRKLLQSTTEHQSLDEAKKEAFNIIMKGVSDGN